MLPPLLIFSEFFSLFHQGEGAYPVVWDAFLQSIRHYVRIPALPFGEIAESDTEFLPLCPCHQ